MIIGLALACHDTTSEELRTSQLRADVEVRSWDEAASAVGVDLRSKKLFETWVQLAPGDRLLVGHAGEERELVEEASRGNQHTYVAWFEGAPVGDPFAVRLEREIDAGAPRTTVELPPPFEAWVDDPEVVLGWSGLSVFWWPPSDDPMRVTVEGSCISNFSTRVANDRGEYHISAGSLYTQDEEDDTWTDECPGELELRREREGEVDPAFWRGDALGVQIRTIDLWFREW